MKKETKYEYDRVDFEQWIIDALRQDGMQPVVPDGFESAFHWSITGDPSCPETLAMTCTVLAEPVPSNSYTAIYPNAQPSIPVGPVISRTFAATPPDPNKIFVGSSASAEPPPIPSKKLTEEELEVLKHLLPDPSYASQILNSKAVIRDMMPGESMERPD